MLHHGLNAGHDLVAGTDFDDLVGAKRRWRHVVGDAHRAFPAAKMVVWPFEEMRGAVQAQLMACMGAVLPIPPKQSDNHHNASLSARKLHEVAMRRGLWRLAKIIPNEAMQWQPFSADQQAGFHAAYQRDLAWLRKQPVQSLEFYDNKNGVCTQTNPDGGRYDNQGS